MYICIKIYDIYAYIYTYVSVIFKWEIKIPRLFVWEKWEFQSDFGHRPYPQFSGPQKNLHENALTHHWKTWLHRYRHDANTSFKRSGTHHPAGFGGMERWEFAICLFGPHLSGRRQLPAVNFPPQMSISEFSLAGRVAKTCRHWGGEFCSSWRTVAGGGETNTKAEAMKTESRNNRWPVACCWAVVCLGVCFFWKLMRKNMEKTSSKPFHLSPGVENFRTLWKVAAPLTLGVVVSGTHTRDSYGNGMGPAYHKGVPLLGGPWNSHSSHIILFNVYVYTHVF